MISFIKDFKGYRFFSLQPKNRIGNILTVNKQVK